MEEEDQSRGDRAQSPDQRQPTQTGNAAMYLIAITATLLLYYTLNTLYFPYLKIDESVYFADSFLVSAFMARTDSVRVMALVIISLLTIAATWRNSSWSTIDPCGAVRFLVHPVILMIIWINALYSYNFYFDQLHAFDRFLILASGIAALIHPGFISLHTVFALISNYQLDFPFGHNGEWTNRMILYQILILFHAFLLCSRGLALLSSRFAPFRRPSLVLRPTLAVFLICCLIVANYFVPGLAKILVGTSYIDWAFENKLGNFVVSAHIYGWNLVPEKAIHGFAAILNELNLPIQIWVLLIEMGSILCFLSRRIFTAFAAGRVALHLGIFLLAGVLFWNWIFLNIAMILAFWRLDTSSKKLLFSKGSFFLSLMIVVGFPGLFKPLPLGWFDSKYTNLYKFYAVDEQGTRYEIEESSFAPYDSLFNHANFYFLSDKKFLTYNYGTTTRHSLFRELEELQDLASIESLKEHYGEYYFSSALSQKMDAFLRGHILHMSRDQVWYIRLLRRLGPPLHLYTPRPPSDRPPSENAPRRRIAPRHFSPEADKVNCLEIELQEFFNDDGSVELIHREVVRRVTVHDGAPRARHSCDRTS